VLTTFLPSCADCLEILEPESPGALRACPGLCLGSFYRFTIKYRRITDDGIRSSYFC